MNNNDDKLFKLRPFIDAVVNNFKTIHMLEKLCVDEQIITFKGRHRLKQYMRNKQKKMGIQSICSVWSRRSGL